MLSQREFYEILLLAVPFLVSLTVHEYAHARTALAFGDPTAKNMGRVTLNPLAHLDPIGTIVLLLSRMIGWAKPVPVNPDNLSPRRLGQIMVSLAGPLSNLSLAVLCGLALRAMLQFRVPIYSAGIAGTIGNLLTVLMVTNVALCVFNLIPLFPLDGHHILRELLPDEHRHSFMAWQVHRGSIVLAVLVFLPRVLSMITGREFFDPIGWGYDQAIRAAVWFVLA